MTPDNIRIREDRNNSIECKTCHRIQRAAFSERNPLYDTWKTMIRRCIDPTFKDWHIYGGKTPPITVCAEWAESLEIFARDMGPRPQGHTLERKDGNGPYCPENCIWATPKQQARNSSRNHFIEIDGHRATIAEFAENANLKYLTLFQRLKRNEPMTTNILRKPNH